MDLKVKYIKAKERWAEKKKSAGFEPLEKPTANRLPPGQHLTKGFPVLDLGIQPNIPLDQWTLKIHGLARHPMELNWEEFNALPQVEDVSDFHCVTTWSKYDCRWSGVPFTEIYERADPPAEAKYVYFTSYDDYTTNLPLDQLLDDDVLIATQFDGQPITREHGGPARIIVPKLYAWKGAKFVREIEFMAEDRLGFWEIRGYSNTADPFTEDRFA